MDDLLTTRQLQDMLRVDRITIYRMLEDGRLRGFKVGGQWRFSRRDIEAWLLEQQTGPGQAPAAPPMPAEGSNASTHVLPITCVQAIQAVCAEALEIAVVTTDLDGNPLASISNSCDFCTLILSTEPGRRRCAKSWKQRPDGQFRPCHGGLLSVSLPVTMDERSVAILSACQFTALEPGRVEPRWQSRLPELAATLALAEADLQARSISVRVLGDSDRDRITRLLQRVADTFSEIGQERLRLLGRLEKIAEMSRV